MKSKSISNLSTICSIENKNKNKILENKEDYKKIYNNNKINILRLSKIIIQHIISPYVIGIYVNNVFNINNFQTAPNLPNVQNIANGITEGGKMGLETSQNM